MDETCRCELCSVNRCARTRFHRNRFFQIYYWNQIYLEHIFLIFRRSVIRITTCPAMLANMARAGVILQA